MKSTFTAPTRTPHLYQWKNYAQEVAVQGPFFEIRAIGNNLPADEWTPHRHEFVEVIWLTHGAGKIVVDLQTYELAPDRICCICPRQLHELKLNGDAEGYVMRFNDSFLFTGNDEPGMAYHSTFYQLLRNAVTTRLDDDTLHELVDIVNKLTTEYHDSRLFRTEMMHRYLKIFFVYLSRQLNNEPEDIYRMNKTLVDKFLGLVEEHYRTNKTVAEYAALLFVTPNYLSGAVKKNTGFSAGHHIRRRIILEAQRQAAVSDVSMKEIAWALGFSDPGHFSKFFKNGCGRRFSDFKRNQVAVA